MSSQARLANQDVVNIFYEVASRFGMDGWDLIEKAGWQSLAVPPSVRTAPFDTGHLQSKPPGLTAAEWEAISSAINALSPSGPTRLPKITNQQVTNVFFEVAAQSGADGWQLVEKAGWQWLAVPPEARNNMFSLSLLQSKPPGLTDAEWQAILAAMDRLLLTGAAGKLEPPGDTTPSEPAEEKPKTPQPPVITPTRQITNQEVVNVFFEVAPRFDTKGWPLVEKAGWQWLATPTENRNALFDPTHLGSKPPGLTAAEWEAISSAVNALLTTAPPEKEKAAVGWPDWWPWKRALVGLHGRGDGLNRDIDFMRFRVARIESAKFLSRAGDEASLHVQQAHLARALSSVTSGPTPIVLRPMYNFPRDQSISARTFVNDVANHMRVFAAQPDVLWLVEIHNEPNVFVEGFEGTWSNGQQFADWWLEARELLRPLMPASAKWGYPGLSPGGPSSFRGSGEHQFFDESKAAWRAADWVAAHSYWQTPEQMNDPNFGMSWKWIQQRSGKPVAITEFANSHPGVSKKDRARQYVEYYRKLRKVEGLLAAYSFIVSVSGEEWPEQKWDDDMAKIVGERDF